MTSSKEYLETTKNGIEIFFDTNSSHAITHFQKNPKLRLHVQGVIKTINITENHTRADFDTGEVLGQTDLVETSETDEVVYALRVGRQTYSRFVKNMSPSPTSRLTLDIRKGEDAVYYLYTAFIGANVPSFPGGDYLPTESKTFWSQHALVWGTQEIVEGTETEICPW